MSSTPDPVPARPALDQEDLEGLLRPLLDDVGSLLGAADLGAQVTGCPGWQVVDLAGHLGGVLQWATASVRAGDPEAGSPERAASPAPSDPREREVLLAWFDQHAQALAEALESAGPEAPAWGFGPRPRTTAFWWRRIVHEAALHAWDVRAAHRSDRDDTAPTAVSEDPALARDGIDEVVTMFFPRQVRTQRCAPLPYAVALEPSEDPDHPGWVLGGDGATDPQDAPASTLAGPADALLLALWQRIPLTDHRLLVTGDRESVADLLTRPIVP